MTGTATPPAESAPVLLEVRNLSAHHGQLPAVRDVSLSLRAGETYAVIGANGAGKSTLLRTLAGLHRPSAGTVRFDGVDVTRLSPERRLQAGIALVPEGRRLFPSLSVHENLLVGTYRARPGPFHLARVHDLFPWMAERRNQKAAALSGGEQQAVALCRALLANPRLLLLDELSLGLAPIIVERIYALLPQLLADGLTVLLVEQDVGQALRVATHLHCLLEGSTTLTGTPDELRQEDLEVAYFGGLHLEPVAPGGAGEEA